MMSCWWLVSGCNRPIWATGPTSPCRLRKMTSPECASLDLTPCTTSTYLGRPPPGDYPLFPGPSGQAIPKQAVVKLFRRVIEQTGATLTRLDPSGQLRQRFHEHVCRVSGAQFSDPTRLQQGDRAACRQVGLRSSRPIHTGVQPRPTHRCRIRRGAAPTDRGCGQTTDHPDAQHFLDCEHRIQQGTPAGHSAMWATQCGWRYATGRHKKIRTKPTNNLRGSCFKFAAQADIDDQG